MDDVSLEFFPFPYVRHGVRHEGSFYKWLERCRSCDRQCELSRISGLQVCSYGVDFYPIDSDMLIAGIVVRDFSSNQAARKKMRRIVPRGPLVQEVDATVQRYRALKNQEQVKIDEEKTRIIEEYKSSEGYKADLLVLLRPDLRKMLAQIHDYRQFVSQVVQNTNVLLESQFPRLSTEEKLRRADHELVAIYWAARLMEEKILAALFLLDPDRIDHPGSYTRFRLHGCVTKYVEIYRRSFDRKGVKIRIAGESYGDLKANPAAVAVIPHTFIDNALKYSPRGSEVIVGFEESSGYIELSVSSLGPRILQDERETIFDLFSRGEEARRVEPDGAGFGLYLSQLVARKLGTIINVAQEEKPELGSYYRTEFSVRFRCV